ncbi:MAG TPA: phosphatase PAP2 family protein [Candidatus Nanopelagicales bacterium]
MTGHRSGGARADAAPAARPDPLVDPEQGPAMAGPRPPRLLPTSAPKRAVLLVGVASAVTLGGLALAVRSGAQPLQRFDASLHAWALETRTQASIAVARGLSYVGAGRITLPALLVVGALAPRGPRPWPTRVGAGAMLAGLAALGGGLGVVLNRSLDRVRPPQADWAGVAVGGSFPSGHTTTATLFAAACVWALLGRVRSRRGRVVLVAACAAFALGVGWSRVWLGVHWPSDVLGGWTYALAWSTLAAAAALAIARSRPGREALREVDRADAQALDEDASSEDVGGEDADRRDASRRDAGSGDAAVAPARSPHALSRQDRGTAR